MKTIGLIGGMSWESTLVYYQMINQGIKEALGEAHSAKIWMYSFDYDVLEKALKNNAWNDIVKLMIAQAKKIEAVGADAILLCANTMHIIADDVQSSISVPLIHIVKATKEVAVQQSMKKVLLLGTSYTMQSDIFPKIFKSAEIEVYTPNFRDQAFIHRTIYHELILGIFLEESKKKMIDIINKFDIDGVILGCTEIPLLIKQKDILVPILNTLEIHVKEAIKFALS